MFESIPYKLEGPVPREGEEPRVYFYGLSFCSHCEEGLSLLEEKGVSFYMAYIDELQPEIRRPVLSALRKEYGKPVMYPVLEVDGEYIVGFNRDLWLERLGLN